MPFQKRITNQPRRSGTKSASSSWRKKNDMKISTILKTRGDLMSADAGTHPIVISSRVRLARNLAKPPFPGWAKKTERVRILEEIKPEVDLLSAIKDGF